jgi:2,5-dioxopentanoate dehydrogenase
MITEKNYIGNQIVGNGSVLLKTFNPELNIENKWDFIEANADEIEMAVSLANQAYKTYKHKSGKEKALFINTIADEILAIGDELLETYCAESGLPRGRAEGERGRTVFQLRTFAEMLEEGSWVEATIDTAIPDRKPLPKDDIRKMLVPIGPIVVFGSSNFPFAYSTAGGDTASALAAGCPVIVKSHPMHLGTGQLVASAIIKAAQKTNMPEGVFSNLISGGHETGVKLVKHPLVKGVGFTGSIKGGKALYDIAAQRPEPIPVFAEMGSVNPVVILPKALEKESNKWASAYAGSITLGTGQFCTNPGLIFGIKGTALTNFIKQLSTEIEKINPGCMLHPNIKNNFDTIKEKVKSQSGVITTVESQNEIKENYGNQTIATTDGNTFINNPLLSHEVFGPFSMVVECENEAQLIKIINGLEGQLTGTVLSEENEIENYFEIVSALQNRVGRIIFNGVPTGVEVCPSMHHGGPYPSSTDSRFTAVGIHAAKRWVRPFCFQNWPNSLLPVELQNENKLNISRNVNNQKTNLPIS